MVKIHIAHKFLDLGVIFSCATVSGCKVKLNEMLIEKVYKRLSKFSRLYYPFSFDIIIVTPKSFDIIVVILNVRKL